MKLREGKKDSQIIFLIHPSGATANFYKDFAKSILGNYAVYGIQSPFLLDEYQCLNNMDAISDIYLDYIRTIQKKDPYIIGGASFGGAVAHAITNKLLNKNEKVKILFMIDTPGPTQKSNVTLSEIEIFSYLFGLDVNFKQMDTEFFDKNIKEQIEYLKLSKKYKKLRLINLEEMYKIYNICKDNIDALHNYHPQKIEQEIIYFQAKERDDFNPEVPSEGWFNSTTKGLVINEVPGSHLTANILPNVKIITSYIEEFLNQY